MGGVMFEGRSSSPHRTRSGALGRWDHRRCNEFAVLFAAGVMLALAGCARTFDPQVVGLTEPDAALAATAVPGAVPSTDRTALAALATPPTTVHATSAPRRSGPQLRRGYYKVGKPYQIAGRWYHPRVDDSYDKIGIASWYGPQFHGKMTANGEVFDMNLLTAAHPTLPIPSLVRVTNLDNNKSVVVRVNDRGPYARDRIIDLSRRTADLLGFIHKGTARVRVTYIGRADLDPHHGTDGRGHQTAGYAEQRPAAVAEAVSVRPASPLAAGTTPATEERYVVVAGAFANQQNAEGVRAALAPLGDAKIVQTAHQSGSTLHRVEVGPFAGKDAAEQARRRAIVAGLADARLALAD